MLIELEDRRQGDKHGGNLGVGWEGGRDSNLTREQQEREKAGVRCERDKMNSNWGKVKKDRGREEHKKEKHDAGEDKWTTKPEHR